MKTSDWKMTERRINKGLTIIEIIVVISIVSIIVSISIPAILYSREIASRNRCTNNLRALAMACNDHLAQNNYYPREEKGYSAQILLLNFMGQSSLYNSINTSSYRYSGAWMTAQDPNRTSFKTQINIFMCPSDRSINAATGLNSYAGNLGTGTGKHNRPQNGPFSGSFSVGKIADSMVRDGTSNTVSMSEFCRSSENSKIDTTHAIFALGSYRKTNLDQLIKDCSSLNDDSKQLSGAVRGQCWAVGGYYNTVYDHNMIPNGRTCSASGSFQGVWPASSNHNNGVNCSFLDGHVAFIKSSIQENSWRSLGTMAGGEILTEQN